MRLPPACCHSQGRTRATRESGTVSLDWVPAAGGGVGGTSPSQTGRGSSGSPHAMCHTQGRLFNCPLAGHGLKKGGVEALGAL